MTLAYVVSCDNCNTGLSCCLRQTFCPDRETWEEYGVRSVDVAFHISDTHHLFRLLLFSLFSVGSFALPLPPLELLTTVAPMVRGVWGEVPRPTSLRVGTSAMINLYQIALVS